YRHECLRPSWPDRERGPCPIRSRLFFMRRSVLYFTRPNPYIGGVTGDAPPMTIDEIIENFALLDDWDDRYRYVIELGRGLAALPESARNQANKVQGCASQVWLASAVKPDGAAGPTLELVGDSDAHIVRGLIAV